MSCINTEKVKELRTKKGWTTTEAAKHIGTSQTMYIYIETGMRTPNLEILVNMAKIYDCEVDELINLN